MTSDRIRPEPTGRSSRRWLNGLRQLKQRFGGRPRTREHLLALLAAARQRALIDTEAFNMIEGVLRVADLRVRDIMIPRAEMVSLRRDDPLDKIQRIAIETAHSRFPVTADGDEVIGILLAKDLLNFCLDGAARPFNIRDLLRSAVFVPDSKRLNVLLREFRASRNHMAIVVDEYGNAAGLVTIEDVLEQIVGEIDDEYDYDEGTRIFRRGRNEFSVKARTPIEDINAHFGTDFPTGEFLSIGGLVMHTMGHLPRRGEAVELGGLKFTVLRADSRRVYLLGVATSEPPADGEPPAPEMP